MFNWFNKIQEKLDKNNLDAEVEKFKKSEKTENEHVAILDDGKILNKSDHMTVMSYLIKLENEGMEIDTNKVTKEQSEANNSLIHNLTKKTKQYEFNPLGFGVKYWDLSKQDRPFESTNKLISRNQLHYVFFLDLQKSESTEKYDSLTFSKGFRFDATGRSRFKPHAFGRYEMRTGIESLVPRHLTNGSLDVRLNEINIINQAQVYSIDKKSYQGIIEMFKLAGVDLDINKERKK